jgi:hypothetical protein
VLKNPRKQGYSTRERLPEFAFHNGGEGYAKGVLNKLVELNVIKKEDVRKGIKPELIRKARELGIIPCDYPF